MSVRDWVDEELRRVSEAQLFGEESSPSAEMDDLDRIDTAEALSIVEAYLRAAREVQGWLKQQLAERITKDGSNFMYGNTLYRVQPKKELVIDDIDELVKLLGDDVPTVFRLDTYNLRTTALLAQQLGLWDKAQALIEDIHGPNCGICSERCTRSFRTDRNVHRRCWEEEKA